MLPGPRWLSMAAAFFIDGSSVNFEFSAEEQALQAEARRFLQAQGTLSLNRAMLDGKGSAQAAKLWNQVAELGWPAATIPEAYGGLGLGHVALCAIAEEVGRAAAPLPLLPSIYLAAEALMQAGSESQKQRWLPKLASGDIIGTLALAGDFTFASGRISGDMSPVPQGVAASVAIVRASREDAAVGLYVVDLTQDGVSRAPVRTIDDSQPHARLVLTSVCCEPLGETCDSDDVMVRVTDRAAVLVAFEQVGGAEACLEAAVAYALQRRSFAKVIGSYQAGQGCARTAARGRDRPRKCGRRI